MAQRRTITSRQVADAAGVSLDQLHRLRRSGVIRPPKRRRGRQGCAYEWDWSEAAEAVGTIRLLFAGVPNT